MDTWTSHSWENEINQDINSLEFSGYFLFLSAITNQNNEEATGALVEMGINVIIS